MRSQITRSTRKTFNPIMCEALDKPMEIKVACNSDNFQNRYIEYLEYICHAKFTIREIECLHLILQGSPVKIIARNYNISPRTVESHIDNIKRKLRVKTQTEILLRYINDFYQLISKNQEA